MTKRSKLKLVALIAALLVAGTAYAAVPSVWSAGQTLSAADLNENFEHVSVLTGPTGKKVSLRMGGYCGATAAPHDDGNAGGYQGIKLRCESACGANTARICTGTDLVIAQSAGVTIPVGRFSMPMRFYAGGAEGDSTQKISDCDGFTTASPDNTVFAWSALGQPSATTCNFADTPFLCCD